MDYKEYFANLKGKTVGVLGIGISNTPLISMLLRAGAKVVAGDRKTEQQLGELTETLKNQGVELILGDRFPNEMYGDIIFRTPGIRPDIPCLTQLKASGSEITSEMEVFFALCPAEIIAVTGSDGKTTTTTLIAEMLKTAGYKVWLGGNIGKPLLPEIQNISPNDKVVAELSSFQLMTFTRSPHIAVMTNLSPNHLDVHKDYREYIDAKKNIMLHQSADAVFVYNADNAETQAVSADAKGITRAFSKTEAGFVHLSENAIYCNGHKILNIADIKIPGMHNVENYMAAIAAVCDLTGPNAIRTVAENFSGVPHRIEPVRTVNGVRYYNSSIDSSPNRTKNTLRVFPQKVILIAGGKDKGIPYDAIGAEIITHVKTLILIGATATAIENAVLAAYAEQKTEPCIPILHAETYPQAVALAQNAATAGDVVLLSPASTSFDMFQNFEERGNVFKKLVMEL